MDGVPGFLMFFGRDGSSASAGRWSGVEGAGKDWWGGHVRVWMNVGKLARSRESVKAEVDRTAEPKGFP
jgi:hypothetical protein